MRRLQDYPRWVRWLIREPVVLTIIVVNAVAVFLDAFVPIHEATHGLLLWIDYACMLYFVAEAGLKMWVFGVQGYLRHPWNRFDLLVVVGSLPLLAAPFVTADVENFAVLLLLRLGRLLRFTRLMRFVPDGASIWQGVVRALKASVAVFFVLILLNLILALGATLLFGEMAPAYFEDPLRASYTLFKVFTVEGWYEIPDRLAEAGTPAHHVFWMRAYFVMAVLIGGILGLSLANAVFVDEMISDNTNKVEAMVAELHEEVRALREELQGRGEG